MEQEIWKDIEDYEGLYQISSLGNVKSIKQNCIKMPEISAHGYFRIGLWKKQKRKNFLVHRLIAIAFIPNPNNLPCINHKDENPLNNSIDNLEWCTYKYNANYGTRLYRIAQSHKMPVIQKTVEGKTVNTFDSRIVAEKETGVDHRYICDCCNGKCKLAGGYIWENA